MKKTILALLLIVSSFSIQAQALKWETDINKAIKISNTSKKPMLLFFTGSDWCGWCIRLQKEVFNTPEFVKWANASVVLVELDFPRAVPQSDVIKAQNNGLQQAFGVQGFPTVWLATATVKNGKPNFTGLGNTGYVTGGSAAWLGVADGILKKN